MIFIGNHHRYHYHHYLYSLLLLHVLSTFDCLFLCFSMREEMLKSDKLNTYEDSSFAQSTYSVFFSSLPNL